MGKITGLESINELPSKVLLLYEAVEKLILEGVDINDIRVSTITEKAGIGKGTAYDYFDSKEEILACAVTFYMRKAMEELKQLLANYDSFTEQIDFLLEEIENNSIKKQCIIRYIHVMTDTSNFSQMVKEKLHTASVKNCLPIGVFFEIVEKAKEQGEVRKDLPVNYMVYVLFSKIIVYLGCTGDDNIINLNAKQIRPYVYQSILDELCEKNV